MTGIRAAAPGEGPALTALALRSKAHWGYDEGFLAACAGFTTDDFEAEFAELEGEEKETAINEKYLDIEQQLIDASEKNELADGSTIIIHTRSVTSKAVDVVKVVNGKKEVAEETKNYARDYFTPDAD